MDSGSGGSGSPVLEREEKERRERRKKDSGRLSLPTNHTNASGVTKLCNSSQRNSVTLDALA
jgi:hypothetical protein